MDTKSDVSAFASEDPVLPVPGPDTHLGRWVWYVYNHLSLALARKLQAYDVTVVEWLVLRELSVAGEISSADLARRLGLARSSISRHAKSLSVKGLVKRRADLHDRRSQSLMVTTTGQGVVPALAALAEQNDAEFFGHLPPEEQNTIRRLLRQTVAHCGRQSGSRAPELLERTAR
jgi:DNA-binding MarR family transcriptional regulator